MSIVATFSRLSLGSRSKTFASVGTALIVCTVFAFYYGLAVLSSPLMYLGALAPFALVRGSLFRMLPTIIIFIILFKNLLLLIAYNFQDGQFEKLDASLYLAVDFYAVLIAATAIMFKKRIVTFDWKILTYLALVSFYSIYGAVTADITSALTYLRVYIAPAVAVILGMMIGNTRTSIDYSKHLRIIYIFFIFLLLFEIIGLDYYYQAINIDNFLAIKYAGIQHPATVYLDEMGTSIFGYRYNRFIGPQFNPISLGYTLFFIMAVFVMARGGLAVLSVPLFLAAITFTSKGAFTAAVLFILVFRLIDSRGPTSLFRKIIVQCLMGIYLVMMLAVSMLEGATSGYTHLLGLYGGISSLVSNPFGHGIGFGGTMSSIKGVEYGGESGLGFVLSHLGFFGIFLYLAVYKKLASVLFSKVSPELRAVTLFLMILLVNSTLQEEPLLPAASFAAWYLFSYWNNGGGGMKRYEQP